MDRGLTKKRCRAEVKNWPVKTRRSPEMEWAANKGNAPATTKPNFLSEDCEELFEMLGTCKNQPLAVFEFPWQNEAGSLAPELDRYRFNDVFFISLVDGCSAAVGYPGDRFSRPRALPMISPATANQSKPSNVDAEDFDSIWGSILRQPLSVLCRTKTFGV